MAKQVDFIEIDKDHTDMLKQFLFLAGRSLETFRYFQTRELDVIRNHLCTYILLEDQVPVGYGHLDQDGDLVWLGIALSESARGKGYGERIMQKLIGRAAELRVTEIRLSVDGSNSAAIRLYQRFGFHLLNDTGNTLFFIKHMTS